MSYIAFARKYRPQVFDDIIGQSHVTTTLKNAITQDRVAHAYLFSGPRGVGKTTAARILAKALNCEKGPIPKPCNVCASCKEITQGSSLDILEIDGASNRGIDEIRNLRDNVKFAPSKGKFKVYIIDEVHMLTSEAFNALLKTLEEPPRHVKFIFATTQAHKVPPTILSRCQRFDFRRIGTSLIVENLKRIVDSESLKIDDGALGLIARYSDGGMRDAQVMLDQITSFANGKVGAEDVTRILGMVADEALFELSAAIRDKAAAKALGTIDRLLIEGKDAAQIAAGLIEHFRNIAISKIDPKNDNLIDAGADKIKRYREEAGAFTVEETLYIIYTMAGAIDFIKKANIARVPLEAALVKLTLNRPILALDEITKRLEALERNHGTESGIAVSQDIKQPSNIPKPPQPAAAEAKAAKPANLGEISGSWSAIINQIMAKKMSVASYLQEGYPASFEKGTLAIGFPKSLQFHKEVLESPENKSFVEAAAKTVLGKEVRVVFMLVEPQSMPNSPGAYLSGTDGDFTGDGGALKKEVDPIVKAAMEIFGGNMADGPSGRR
ncbi:MAG: DNA polymerase III subunit gamma/tau [Candidatus Omnitrophota bacterium]